MSPRATQPSETMNSLVQNFINGNLADARKQARRFGHTAIRLAFMDIGYSFQKAALTADYLKTGEGFQAACDAE